MSQTVTFVENVVSLICHFMMSFNIKSKRVTPQIVSMEHVTAEPWGYEVMGSQGQDVAGSCGHGVIWSRGHGVTGSRGHGSRCHSTGYLEYSVEKNPMFNVLLFIHINTKHPHKLHTT